MCSREPRQRRRALEDLALPALGCDEAAHLGDLVFGRVDAAADARVELDLLRRAHHRVGDRERRVARVLRYDGAVAPVVVEPQETWQNPKADRAEVFAAWLDETFGRERLALRAVRQRLGQRLG